MTTYIPLIIAICSIGFALLNLQPNMLAKIEEQHKIYEQARVDVETATKEENNLKLQALKAYQENSPFNIFNSTWGNIANSVSRPEEVSRLITREAQQLGLRIANSRLEDPIQFNTMEGTVQARPFTATVEGTHQQIGQWLIRCEGLIRTLRVVSTTWFPYGAEVQADVLFQLMDDDRLFSSGEKTLALPAWLQTEKPKKPNAPGPNAQAADSDKHEEQPKQEGDSPQ